MVGANGVRNDRADPSIGVGHQYKGYFGVLSLGQDPMFIVPEAFDLTNGFAMVRSVGDQNVDRQAPHAYGN